MFDQNPQLFATRRASQLGVFRGMTPTSFDDPFVVPPLSSSSIWQNRISSQGTITQLTDGQGGITRLDTGTVSGGDNGIMIGTSDARPALIADPGADGTRWYLLWIFRVASTPDNQTELSIGFRPTVESGVVNALFFGVDGLFESTVKLVGEENILNATLSDVSIATGAWHYLEAYQLGIANDIKFRFDGESEKTLTMTGPFNGSGVLNMNASNGTTLASQLLDSDHVVLLMDGNLALPTA